MPSNPPLQRSLSLLRRLQLGPADRDELIDFVHVDYDGSAYTDIAHKSGQKRLENDLQRLRDRGVAYEFRDKQYHLLSFGNFNPICLTDDALNTLAFLAESFGPQTPNGEDVQDLVRVILDRLPERQRASLPTRRQRLRMDLRRVDNDTIDPTAQDAIERALNGRRLLRFRYRSPSQRDGEPRLHEVQPWKLYYDTVRRHLYLDAFCLQVTGPQGVWKRQQWQPYRLGRILADGIEVLPDRLPPTPPKRPRYTLDYWLAPDIVRLGEITRHFDDMQVHEANADGWVRVTAVTDDLFSAVRLLLTYGPNCKVIGGSEARREMESLVTAMAAHYAEHTTE